MSYTYMPTGVLITVFFLGLIYILCYSGYTLIKFIRNYEEIKKYSWLSKIIMFGSLIYGYSLLIVFMVHATMSGLYHDANATGPSDAEFNFRLLNLVFALCVLAISNSMIKEGNMGNIQ